MSYTLKSYDKLPPRQRTSQSQYPFEAMTAGQWFFVPFNDGKDISKSLSTAATTAGKRFGKKFSVRTIEHDGVKGAGVYCSDPS